LGLGKLQGVKTTLIMKKTTRRRLFEVVQRLDKTFKPTSRFKLNETGEWANDEDDLAWIEMLKSEVQKIESATNGKLELIDVRGFDKYQGPYAQVKINGRNYRIWTAGEGDYPLLWIDNYPVDNTSAEGMNPGYAGTPEMIIELLNSQTPVTENLSSNRLNVNDILDNYLEAAFWTEEQQNPELQNKMVSDIDSASLQKTKNDIMQFLRTALQQAGEELKTYDSKSIGHNLWLSRNGHGAGFFDDNNDKLQDIARNMKSSDLYIGDDGKVYLT
jgi:hypothetical protein